MDRVFLDANVLFSAAYTANNSLRRLWHLPRTALLSSEYAIEEARRNLTPGEQRTRLSDLAAGVTVVAGVMPLPPGIELPDKDVPILAAALAAQASHLLTGDHAHFGIWFDRALAGVYIVTPGEYLRRREAHSHGR